MLCSYLRSMKIFVTIIPLPISASPMQNPYSDLLSRFVSSDAVMLEPNSTGLDLNLSLGPSRVSSASTLPSPSSIVELVPPLRSSTQGPLDVASNSEMLTQSNSCPNILPPENKIIKVDRRWHLHLNEGERMQITLLLCDLCSFPNDGVGYEMAREVARKFLTYEDYIIITDENTDRSVKLQAALRAMIQRRYAQKRLMVKALLINHYQMPKRSAYRHLERAFSEGSTPNEDYRLIADQLYRKYEEALAIKDGFGAWRRNPTTKPADS